MRRSIVADQAVLESWNCTAEKIPVELVSNRPNEVHNTDHHIEVFSHPSGWKFQSFHRHILNDRERKDFAASFRKNLRQLFPSLTTTHSITEEDDDSLHWDNFKLHIPPMLFGRDIMRFDFKTWGSVAVSAQDALFCWLCQHVPEVSDEHALQVIQVPYAKKWVGRLSNTLGSPSSTIAHHISPIHGITPIQEISKHHAVRSSPTLSSTPSVTPISKDGIPPPPAPSFAHATPEALHCNHFGTDGHPSVTSIRASDWTYSTDYCCSLLPTNHIDPSSAQQQLEPHLVVHGQPFHGSNLYPLCHGQRNADVRTASPWVVTEESTCGIDYELLRRRDMPILFYDEMTLYEDDLEDCGEISIEAKVRIMPNCWFALVRYFLRIDNVLVRSRETRLFHEFPSASGGSDSPDEALKIHVEVLWREKHLDEDAGLFPAVAAQPSKVLAAGTPVISPATSAVLRTTAPGASLPPALAKVMQGTAAAAAARASMNGTTTSSGTSTSTSNNAVTTSNEATASHLAPISTHLLPQRYTKDNASEVLPRVNETLRIPAYFTFTLRNPDDIASSSSSQTAADHEMQPNNDQQQQQQQQQHRHWHWFGLAAAHGVRR